MFIFGCKSKQTYSWQDNIPIVDRSIFTAKTQLSNFMIVDNNC